MGGTPSAVPLPVIKEDTSGGKWTPTPDGKSWQPVKEDTKGGNWTLGPDKKTWEPLHGSVFSGPDTPATGDEAKQNLKSLGKKAVEFGVGTVLPVAAGVAAGAALGPEAAGPTAAAVRTGAQAVGGALTPYAQYFASKAMGEHPEWPTFKDAAKSAVFNAALHAAGEGGTAAKAGSAAPVADEIKGLPREAQTPANIKAAVTNRDFWKKMGVPESQIDAIKNDPAMLQSAEAGTKYKDAFQTVLTDQRGKFQTRYADAYKGMEDTPIAMQPTADAIKGVMEHLGEQRQLNPGLQRFLQSKQAEFEGAAPGQTPTFGKSGSPVLQSGLLAKIKAQSPQVGSTDLPAHQLRDFITELHNHLPKGASQIDKMAVNQVEQAAEGSFDKGLTDAGAKPEQLAAFDAIRKNYRQFMNTTRELDPRAKDFGTDVANELWDSAKQNPGNAIHFLDMAKAAEVVRPNEVMPQLRESFLNKLMTESKVSSQGRPFEEMKAVQTLQNQWGEKLPTVLSGVFGKDSPIADPTKLATVLGKLSAPDATAAEASKGVLGSLAGNLGDTSKMLLRLGVAYGAYRAIAGGKGSPWQDLSKPSFIPSMIALMLGTKVATFALTSADTAMQHAYVDFLLNPNAKSLTNVTSVLGGMGGAAEGMPKTASPTAMPRLHSPSS